jgi:hypothetical protein
MADIPNSKSVVERARTKYDHLSGPERAFRVVNQVAWDLRDLGAGLFFKPGGSQHNERSLDVIIFQPNGETFDVLGDAEGEARPQWGRTTPTGFGDVTRWRAPENPDPDLVDLAVVISEIAALKSMVVDLTTAFRESAARQEAKHIELLQHIDRENLP